MTSRNHNTEGRIAKKRKLEPEYEDSLPERRPCKVKLLAADVPYINCRLDDVETKAYLQPGFKWSVVGREFVKNYSYMRLGEDPLSIYCVDGRLYMTKFKVLGVIDVFISMDVERSHDHMMVVESVDKNTLPPIILGSNILKEWSTCFHTRRFSIPPNNRYGCRIAIDRKLRLILPDNKIHYSSEEVGTNSNVRTQTSSDDQNERSAEEPSVSGCDVMNRAEANFGSKAVSEGTGLRNPSPPREEGPPESSDSSIEFLSGDSGSSECILIPDDSDD